MNSSEENRSTKVRILKAANTLFAKKGFGETSIREIANTAKVNLAAINYHFTNKDNLYWEVFKYNHDKLDMEIKKISKKTKTTEDLAAAVFNFFVKNESTIMNTFKIVLSGKSITVDSGLEKDESDSFGPPGQNAFLEKIQHDLGDSISVEGQRWAMKVSFSLLVHFGVMVNTAILKKKCNFNNEFKPKSMEKALRHAVKANLAYLKANPNVFSK